MTALLVEGLTIRYRSGSRHGRTGDAVKQAPAVEDLSLSIDRGETLALVGESGSGKSTTGLAIAGLLPVEAEVHAKRLEVSGIDLLTMSPTAMSAIRGARVGMVFQDAMSALNPLMTIGQQITEAIRLHQPVARAAADLQALALLKLVGMPQPDRRMTEYPHRLSGGMRQRVVIAIALASEPDVLIADEPTTALDVTVQAQILDCLSRIQVLRGLAILLITHDLGVVAEMADRVMVMRHGKVLEAQSAAALFADPTHDYTRQLLDARPRVGARA